MSRSRKMYCCSSRLHSHRRQPRRSGRRNQSSPSCDPTAPSQLLGKWLLSRQLDCKLQPLRVGVVEDSIARRSAVQEGDELSGANETMLEAESYSCSSEGSAAFFLQNPLTQSP